MQSLGWEALILVTPHSGPQESLSIYTGTAKELDSISRYPFQLQFFFFNVLEILTLELEELAFRPSFSFAFESQSLSFLINKKRMLYSALPGHVFENLNLEENSQDQDWWLRAAYSVHLRCSECPDRKGWGVKPNDFKDPSASFSLRVLFSRANKICFYVLKGL